MPLKRHNLRLFTKNAPQSVIDSLCVFKFWSLYRIRSTRFSVIGFEDSISVSMSDHRLLWPSAERGVDPKILSMQIIPSRQILYLLGIGLSIEYRGRGYGNELYNLVIDFARGCGCSQVRQTPSGTCIGGESRLSYLQRRGWVRDGLEVVVSANKNLNSYHTIKSS